MMRLFLFTPRSKLEIRQTLQESSDSQVVLILGVARTFCSGSFFSEIEGWRSCQSFVSILCRSRAILEAAFSPNAIVGEAALTWSQHSIFQAIAAIVSGTVIGFLGCESYLAVLGLAMARCRL